jgi:hypothetical protein
MTETCKIEDLLTNPYNRDIDPVKVSHIKAEIQRTGKVYPIVYSEVDNDGKPGKMITDGHHRFFALKELGHTDVPVIMSDERGLDTKAPKEEVEKKRRDAGGNWIRTEGDKWVLYTGDNRKVGESDTREGIQTQRRMLEYLEGNQVAKNLAKAWFGDPEGHARAAALRGDSPGPEVDEPAAPRSKTDLHDGLKTAVKTAAIVAIAAGGIAALRSTAVRGLIANAAKNVTARFPASGVGRSAYATTLANGGHTVSMAGEVPVARYMFSPFKAQEKVIPIKNFTAHSVDGYIKQNKATLAQPGNYLGTWHNKETGKVHLDISVPHNNRYQALLAAEKHKQLAIYDSVAGKDIPVNASTIGQAKFVDTVRERYEYAPHSWKPALHDEGFGLDVLKEVGDATRRGATPGQMAILYNRTNGYYGVGAASREHSDIFVQLVDYYGAKVQGDMDTRWARMTYSPTLSGPGKLNLWNWSTEMEHAKGSASRNYADTFDSILRNKNFPDDLVFGVKEPFRNLSSEKTLGEWRKEYAKGMKAEDLMKTSEKPEENEIVDVDMIPNRTAMFNVERAEHPDLTDEAINQIVEDHLKAGKDILYKKALCTFSKAAALVVSRGLAKVYRVEKPTEDLAQANTQESIAQVQSVDDSLVALHGALKDLELLARDQQLLSEDEMQAIIQPLQAKVEELLSTLQGDTAQSPEAEQPTEAADDSEAEAVETDDELPEDQTSTDDPQRQRKKPQGPERTPGTGTAERELTEPASTFSEKADTVQDINKGFFGIGGSGQRGWRGDPQGHAEAARERWAGEGVPLGGRPKPTGAQKPGGAQKPTEKPHSQVSEAALVLPRAVKDIAVQTAGRAGRSLARAAGDTIADIGWQAFGTVAGIVLFRYLSGSSTNVGAMAALGKAGLKDALKRSFQMARIDQLSKKIKLARLVRVWAETK